MKGRAKRREQRTKVRAAKRASMLRAGGKSKYARKAEYCLARGVPAITVVDKAAAWGGSNETSRQPWWFRCPNDDAWQWLGRCKPARKRRARRRGGRGQARRRAVAS